VDVAAQVSPSKRRAFDKERNDVATQTEAIKANLERKEENKVGTQTEAMFKETPMIKRKEITPIANTCRANGQSRGRAIVARVQKRVLAKA
jgi:hypothetical protein